MSASPVSHDFSSTGIKQCRNTEDRQMERKEAQTAERCSLPCWMGSQLEGRIDVLLIDCPAMIPGPPNPTHSLTQALGNSCTCFTGGKAWTQWDWFSYHGMALPLAESQTPLLNPRVLWNKLVSIAPQPRRIVWINPSQRWSRNAVLGTYKCLGYTEERLSSRCKLQAHAF